MQETGTIKILLSKGLTDVPAIRLGKFWGAHPAQDAEKAYNVTHRATGRAFVTYLKLRHAQKLVRILDVVMPSDLYSECEMYWNAMPAELRDAFVAMQYTS